MFNFKGPIEEMADLDFDKIIADINSWKPGDPPVTCQTASTPREFNIGDKVRINQNAMNGGSVGTVYDKHYGVGQITYEVEFYCTAKRIFYEAQHLSPLPANWNQQPVMATQLPSGSGGAKFKEGDKVRHVWGHGRSDDGVIADDGSFLDGNYTYWVKFPTHAMFCREQELVALDSYIPEHKNVKCECGSEKTYGSTNLHSSWCPKAGY